MLGPRWLCLDRAVKEAREEPAPRDGAGGDDSVGSEGHSRALSRPAAGRAWGARGEEGAAGQGSGGGEGKRLSDAVGGVIFISRGHPVS